MSSYDYMYVLVDMRILSEDLKVIYGIVLQCHPPKKTNKNKIKCTLHTFCLYANI